jgi:hypothetical protein
MPSIDAVPLLKIFPDRKWWHFCSRYNVCFHLRDEFWSKSKGEPLWVNSTGFGTTIIIQVPDNIIVVTTTSSLARRYLARRLVVVRIKGG